MKILLINPRFPRSLWDFSGSRDLDGSRYPYFPLALPTLAALCPSEADIVIQDENVAPLDYTLEADIVGITGYDIQKERAFEIAERFRGPGRVVALGGAMVNDLSLNGCLEHADAVFVGEAEYSWPKFLGDVRTGRPERVYRSAGFVDLADTPEPRFELLSLRAYTTATIETSRGCPYRCEFCEIPVKFGTRTRQKSVDQVMAEVRALHGLGADSIFFIDDNFVGNKRKTKQLLMELGAFVRSISYSLYFMCQLTVNMARDDELLELLRAANFRRVFIGLETAETDTLLSVKKTQNTSLDMVQAVRKIQSFGILVWAGLIVGFDADGDEVFADQQTLLKDAAIPVAMVSILQAIPGTPLYERIRKEGRLSNEDPGGVRAGYDTMTRTNILRRPDARLDQDRLVQGYRELVRAIYAPEAFGRRLIDALALSSGVNGSKLDLDPEKFRIVGRVARYFLFAPQPGMFAMFLKVLAFTLLRKPGLLEQVFVHLIAYKHLNQYFADISSQRT